MFVSTTQYVAFWAFDDVIKNKEISTRKSWTLNFMALLFFMNFGRRFKTSIVNRPANYNVDWKGKINWRNNFVYHLGILVYKPFSTYDLSVRWTKFIWWTIFSPGWHYHRIVRFGLVDMLFFGLSVGYSWDSSMDFIIRAEVTQRIFQLLTSNPWFTSHNICY